MRGWWRRVRRGLGSEDVDGVFGEEEVSEMALRELGGECAGGHGEKRPPRQRTVRKAMVRGAGGEGAEGAWQ